MTDDAEKEPVIIPDHESPLRSILHEEAGIPYYAVQSLDEARSHDDGVVVLTADWEGQILATCPVHLVNCSEDTLHQLLRDLDAISWPTNEGEGTAVYYERHPLGMGIGGGMGGAV